MPSPEELAAQQRRALLSRDRALLRDLATSYRGTHQSIRAQLDQLAEQIRDARRRGEPVNRTWLLRQRRLELLERQVEGEMRVFLTGAEQRISAARLTAVISGRDDAGSLISGSLGPSSLGSTFQPVFPVRAFEETIARTRRGRPLAELLARLGPEAAQAVRSELLLGVALGRNPRDVARAAARASTLGLTRSLVIARTEMLGAYRAAAHETYKTNERVIGGWLWMAELGPRTCGVCWAMHGSLHTLDETLDTHISCRCTMAPVTKTWAELGFPGVPETRLQLESGPDVFARQDAGLQRQVLGPGKYRLYQDGKLNLGDLVEETSSSTWGKGRRERSLRDVA